MPNKSTPEGGLPQHTIRTLCAFLCNDRKLGNEGRNTLVLHEPTICNAPVLQFSQMPLICERDA